MGIVVKYGAATFEVDTVAEATELLKALKGEPAAIEPSRDPAAPVVPMMGADSGMRVRNELLELMPWIGVLSGMRRQAVEMRSRGIGPTEIARQLGTSMKSVAQAIGLGRARMRAARDRGAAPSEDVPDPAPPAPAARRRLIAESAERLFPARPAPELPAPVHIPAPVVRARKPTVDHEHWREIAEAREEAAADDGPDVEAPALEAIPDGIETETAGSTLITPPNFVPVARVVQSRQATLANKRAITLPFPRVIAAQIASNPVEYPAEIQRPRTRGDCVDGPRPCPFVSCKHHLYLSVDDDSGALKLPWAEVDPDQIPETCSLDVADRGGITLEEVGAILNLTRERVRQMELVGSAQMREYGEQHYENPGEPHDSPAGEAFDL